jgi:hypothetical protein
MLGAGNVELAFDLAQCEMWTLLSFTDELGPVERSGGGDRARDIAPRRPTRKAR